MSYKIGIIDADLLDNGTRHPNLALMKISAYHKKLGDHVELLKSYEDLNAYSIVYISKVFKYSHIDRDILLLPNVKYGGTGFYEDGGDNLEYEIEHQKPDYELYSEYISNKIAAGVNPKRFSDYQNFSIGFATRGCFRKCDFCVNKKYTKVFRHAKITEFLDNKRPGIYLWDDNIFGYSKWYEVFDELEKTGKVFQFRQGLDVRLLNDEKAERLAKSRYKGDIIFAFDHVEDKELIEQKLRLWRKYSKKTTKLYILCAFDSQDEKDIENIFIRIKVLMRMECLPYIMRYEKYKESEHKNLYIQIARWCNQPQFFKKKSFREYCVANQVYHKNQNTLCSSMIALNEFEKKWPTISQKYFDMKYEELKGQADNE